MRLSATSNNGIFHLYTTEKTEDFFSKFIKFLKELGFEEEIINGFKGNFIINDFNNGFNRKKNVFELRDKILKIDNQDYKIELFFGYKKIIIRIELLNNDRKDFIKNVFYRFDWISEEQKELRYNINCLKELIRIGDFNFVRKIKKELKEFKTEFFVFFEMIDFLSEKGIYFDKIISDLRNIYDDLEFNKKLCSNNFVCIIYSLRNAKEKINMELDERIKKAAIKDLKKKIKLSEGFIELSYLIVNL